MADAVGVRAEASQGASFATVGETLSIGEGIGVFDFFFFDAVKGLLNAMILYSSRSHANALREGCLLRFHALVALGVTRHIRDRAPLRCDLPRAIPLRAGGPGAKPTTSRVDPRHPRLRDIR